MPRISAKLAKANRQLQPLPPGVAVASDMMAELDPTTTVPAPPDGPGTAAVTRDQHGRQARIKTLYATRGSGLLSGITWVELEPSEVDDDDEAARHYDEAAIRLFKKPRRARRHENVNSRAYELETIRIQSPYLCRMLAPVVAKYGVLASAREDLALDAPFQALFHGLEEIRAVSTPSVARDAEHLGLLLRVLDDIFAPRIERLDELRQEGLIDFENLWTLFPKNEIVVGHHHEHQSLFSVESVQEKTDTSTGRFLVVRGSYFEFDGVRYGAAYKEHLIRHFDGYKAIVDVGIYPARLHPNKDYVQRFVARGRRVLAYQGIEHRSYKGIAYTAGLAVSKPHKIDERVIVDAHAYSDEFSFGRKLDRVDYETGTLITNREDPLSLDDRDGSDDEWRAAAVPNTPPGRPSSADRDEMTSVLHENKRFLLLLSPMLRAFGLRLKEWIYVFVDGLSPVVWNETAFDHLVYPEAKKHMIHTFIANFESLRQGASDVVLGKGEAMIMLFSGPPGTGKTLTAEAIADKTRRPLYRLEAEDIGTDPARVGQNLSRALNLVNCWRGIVLLDEADVFMAKRKMGDMRRNELVAVFLRELEYIKGIMILTTNLEGELDEAFRSRIHVHLQYPELSRASRREIWHKLLTRAGDERRVDLDKLSQWTLNGREIKNAVNLVRGWCLLDGAEWSVDRLETAIEVTCPTALFEL